MVTPIAPCRPTLAAAAVAVAARGYGCSDWARAALPERVYGVQEIGNVMSRLPFPKDITSCVSFKFWREHASTASRRELKLVASFLSSVHPPPIRNFPVLILRTRRFIPPFPDMSLSSRL